MARKSKSLKVIKIMCTSAMLVPKEKLVPFQGDLVFSTEDEIEALKHRIITKGFDSPIKAWENDGKYHILDGHRRKIVLNRLEDDGWKLPNIPIDLIKAKDEKDAKERILGFRSQFGRVTQDSFDDFVKINDLEINDQILRMGDIEIGPTIEMDIDSDLVIEEELTEDDEIEDKSIFRLVNYGDVIKTGKHKVICGSSQSGDTFKKLFGNDKFGLAITAPPFNNKNLRFPDFKERKTGKSKNMTKKEYKDFMLAVLHNTAEYAEIDSPLFWNVSYNTKSRDDYGRIIFSDLNKFTVKESIMWEKTSKYYISSKGILSRGAEFIFLMSKGAKYKTNQKKRGIGDSVYFNVWKLQNTGKKFRGIIEAVFPVELPFKAITDFSTSENDIIFDPFMGSGNTLIAAEMTGRRSYGIEIESRCCDVMIYQYCKYMHSIGKQPKVLINGKVVKIPYSFKKIK